MHNFVNIQANLKRCQYETVFDRAADTEVASVDSIVPSPGTSCHLYKAIKTGVIFPKSQMSELGLKDPEGSIEVIQLTSSHIRVWKTSAFCEVQMHNLIWIYTRELSCNTLIILNFPSISTTGTHISTLSVFKNVAGPVTLTRACLRGKYFPKTSPLQGQDMCLNMKCLCQDK